MIGHDSTPWIKEAMLPVLRKFEDRLEGDLSEKDLLAAYSAIAGALAVGMRQGIADAVFQIETEARERGNNLTVHCHINIADYDPWAEAYEK
jgi:hypothetical protein